MASEEQDESPTAGKHLAPPIDLNWSSSKDLDEYGNGTSSAQTSKSLSAKYDFEEESNPTSRTSLDASSFDYDIASPISGRSGRHVPSLTSSLHRMHGRRLSSVSLTMSLANSSTISGLMGTRDQSAYPTSISSLVDYPNSKFTVRPPTSRDIPLVTLSATPRISFEELQPYLSATSDDYRSLKSSKNMPTGDRSFIERDSSSALSDIVPVDVAGASTESVSHIRSGIQSPISSIAPELKSALELPSISKNPVPFSEPSLDTIPSVFFEDSFSLQNPRIFNLVTEKAELLSPYSENLSEHQLGNKSASDSRDNSKLLANNAIMQEKLSWYLDVVEVNLINEISKSSSSFFEALSSLKDLGNESTEIISRLQETRNSLVNIGEKRAQAGLQLWELKRKRAHARRLSIALKQVLLVMEYGDLAEKQLEKGCLSEAFSTLECCRLLIDGQLDKSPTSKKSLSSDLQINLRSVRGLDDLRENIAVLGNRIGKEYELRLTECLMTDLKSYVESASPRQTLMRLCRTYTLLDADKGVIFRHFAKDQDGQTSDYSLVSTELRKELSIQFDGVSQCKAISGAEKSLRDAILREFKTIIRKNLPHDDDVDDDNISISSSQSGLSKTADLTRRLRALSPDDNEKMLVNIFTQLSEALRRLSTLQKVLLDISSRSRLSKSDHFKDSQDTSNAESKSLDLSSTISDAVAQSQDRITKIYNVRRDQNASLDFFYFMRFYTLSGLFISESEALTGLTGSNLQRTVISSVRQFLRVFHDSSIKRTLSAIENDRWTDEYIKVPDQVCADRIVESATSDPVGWTSEFWERLDISDSPTQEGEESPEKRTKVLTVGNDDFMVSTSGLKAIHFMETYLEVISSFRHVAADSAGDLVELLRLVNSRVCQVILGAGATRSAELKSITAKHLALSSQTLGLIITLIPYCRAFIQRRISNISSVLTELDKVRRSYQQHQEEVYDKLVSIMRERLQSHIINIRRVDFSAASETDDEAHTYMVALIRDLTKLAKICKRYLPEISAEHVLRQILQIYGESLLAEFQKILATKKSNAALQSGPVERQPSNNEESEDTQDTQEIFPSMQRDADYFCKSIADMPGHENARTILKPIVTSTPAPPPPEEAVAGSSAAADTP